MIADTFHLPESEDSCGDFGRRLGRFFLPTDMIRERPNETRRLMSGMIVVRAERRWDRDGIDYMAMCDQFEPVPEYVVVPDYMLTVFHSDDGSARFEWRKGGAPPQS